MRMAESMKSLTEDILVSYDVRGKALGDIVADTRKTIKGFASDREKMSREQAEALADYVKNLTKDVGLMMSGFKKEHKEMSEEIREKLAKETKEIETCIKKLLKEFEVSRLEMSGDLKKSLTKYIGDIKSSVKELVGEYRSDIANARRTWQGMAATLAKAKEKGVMPRIEAGEKAATVEEAVAKRKGKKRSRKAKRVKEEENKL